MSDIKLAHIGLTKLRAVAYKELFGSKPEKIFPSHVFNEADDAYLIDVLIFPLEIEEFSGRIVAAVTNGMSDHLMTDTITGEHSRCELIQYFHDCDYEHAQRLYDLAWMPLFDNFSLGEYQTIEMPDEVAEDSLLKNAFFMPPLLKPHRLFRFNIEGMPTRLLWHIPISDAELRYKKNHDANALIKLLQDVELPWIFDEVERPPLIG
jgi:hypothetical protein